MTMKVSSSLYSAEVAFFFDRVKEWSGQMPIFRVEKTRNYTVMSNYHLKDKTLSLKSKGLLSVILSLPDEWNYTTRGLAAISKDGVDSIGAALKELETVGYLVRNRIRDKRGRIADVEYVVYECPQVNPGTTLPDTALPDIALPGTGLPDTASPYTENPYLDKPYMDIPYTENPAQLITNESLRDTKGLSTNELSTQKHLRARASVACSGGSGQPSPDNIAFHNQQAECLTVQMAQGAGKPVNHTMTLVEQNFELFWQLYPHKAGKKAAKKAWMGIKPAEPMFSTIMNALNAAINYWDSQSISLKHIPHPSTWIIEERWEDEFSTRQLSTRKVEVYSKTPGGEQLASIGANYTIGGDGDPYRELM